MTKRKRTPPSPSPAPRKRVIFEIPRSLYRFQAIARELARQSELFLPQADDSPDRQSCDSQPLGPGAPRFDAQTFQNNALRFSPYSRQPFLPSQPWPQPTNSNSASPEFDANDAGTVSLAASRVEGARQISAGPDDQLFDELNDALHAEDDDDNDDGGADVSGAQSQYLTTGNRLTFESQAPMDWNGMRPEPYQHFMPSYPQTSNSTSLPIFSSTSTLAHHHPPPTRTSSNSFLPSSSTTTYHPKPQPPKNSGGGGGGGGGQTKSSVPGYYKSSLKLWSQEDTNEPRASPSQAPTPHFRSTNSAYPQLPYSGSITTYRPPPIQPPHHVPLASTPVSAYTNYGNPR